MSQLLNSVSHVDTRPAASTRPKDNHPLARVFLIAAAFLLAGCSEGPPTPAELDAITTLQSLRGQFEMNAEGHALQLNMRGLRIRDDDLIPLEQFHDLEQLNLQQTPITDAGVAHLKNLAQLKRLSLKGTDITDEGIGYLTELPLEELDLEYTKITSAGLAKLAAVTTLRRVYVGPGGSLSAGAEYLRKAVPLIHVQQR